MALKQPKSFYHWTGGFVGRITFMAIQERIKRYNTNHRARTGRFRDLG